MPKNGRHDIDEVIQAPPIEHVVWDFSCPPGSSIATFAMRTTSFEDDLEAALNAEVRATSAQLESPRAMNSLVLREKIRLATVEVDGKPVGEDGMPFFEIESYTSKTLSCMTLAFLRLNLMTEDETASFVAGGKPRGPASVKPPASRSSQTPNGNPGEVSIARPSRG